MRHRNGFVLTFLFLATSASALFAQTTLPTLTPVATLEAGPEDVFDTGGLPIPNTPDFGTSVASLEDTVLVGTRGGGRSRVAVFTKGTANEFARTATLDPLEDDSQFGVDIALSFNAALIRGTDAIYLFRRAGSAWAQKQRLTPAAGEEFLDMAFNLQIAAVSVRNIATGETAVDIYIPNLRGQLQAVKRVTASDSMSGDAFGTDLSLQLGVLAVGAPGANDNQGAVYLFNLLSRAATESQKLLATDGMTGDRFGTAVALKDGILAIGAPRANLRDSGSLSGAVYVFTPDRRFWVEAQKLSDPTNSFLEFGNTLAASRNFIAARSTAVFAGLDGGTTVFKRQGALFQPVALADVSMTAVGDIALDRGTLYLSTFFDRVFPQLVNVYDLQ
jgi:hypothetical protein